MTLPKIFFSSIILAAFNVDKEAEDTTKIVKALKKKLTAKWLKKRINGEDKEKMKKFNKAFEITISQEVHHDNAKQYEIEFTLKYKPNFTILKKEFNKKKAAGKKCPGSFKTVAYRSGSFQGGNCGYKKKGRGYQGGSGEKETRWKSWDDCEKDIT